MKKDLLSVLLPTPIQYPITRSIPNLFKVLENKLNFLHIFFFSFRDQKKRKNILLENSQGNNKNYPSNSVRIRSKTL